MQAGLLFNDLYAQAGRIVTAKAALEKEEAALANALGELRRRVTEGESSGNRFLDFAIASNGFSLLEMISACEALTALELSLEGKKGQLILTRQFSGSDITDSGYWRLGIISSEQLTLTAKSCKIEANPIHDIVQCDEPLSRSPLIDLYAPGDWLDYLRLRTELTAEKERKKWLAAGFMPPMVALGNEEADLTIVAEIEKYISDADSECAAWLAAFNKIGFDHAQLPKFEALRLKLP